MINIEHIQFSQEEWKSVKNFEGLYEVSNTGLVRSLDRYVNISKGNKRIAKGKLLKMRTNNNGYLIVDLYKNNKLSTFLVHRLVAIAYIPNEKKLPQVNHRNGCKTCNYLENLEWIDAKGNIQHAIEIGLINREGCNHPLSIKIIDTITGQLFCSIKELSIYLNLDYSITKLAVNGKIPFPKTVNIEEHNYQRYSC